MFVFFWWWFFFGGFLGGAPACVSYTLGSAHCHRCHVMSEDPTHCLRDQTHNCQGLTTPPLIPEENQPKTTRLLPPPLALRRFSPFASPIWTDLRRDCGASLWPDVVPALLQTMFLRAFHGATGKSTASFVELLLLVLGSPDGSFSIVVTVFSSEEKKKIF